MACRNDCAALLVREFGEEADLLRSDRDISGREFIDGRVDTTASSRASSTACASTRSAQRCMARVRSRGAIPPQPEVSSARVATRTASSTTLASATGSRAALTPSEGRTTGKVPLPETRRPR